MSADRRIEATVSIPDGEGGEIEATGYAHENERHAWLNARRRARRTAWAKRRGEHSTGDDDLAALADAANGPKKSSDTLG